ncbi:MAG: peptidase prepilin type [Micavibrio sp.]|nr:peptidase prepilin type [Micavibrio sp.]
MQVWIVLGCLVGALGVLITLSVIDLRVRLLPNTLVLTFALLGVAFHIATKGSFLTPLDMVIGAALGYGILFSIRFVANHLYQQDTLGLGDVKLLGAAGLWLGPEGTLAAMTLGAFAGMLHGLGVALYTALKTKSRPSLSRLEVPAGPGFAVGIIAVGLYQFGYLGDLGLSWLAR